MPIPTWVLTVLMAAAPTGPGGRLALRDLPEDSALAELLWGRAPDLQDARARVAVAGADAARARLFPNPQADLSWNTLPIGPTNPPGLRPLRDVPNYAVTLSELVELGKRGPRQRSTAEAAGAAALNALDALRGKVLDLLGHVGAIASAEVRIASLAGLAADAARLTVLTRGRAGKGDAAELDVDRAALEEEKLQGALHAEEARLAQELLLCGDVAGVPCDPFGDPQRAAAFLEARSASPATSFPGLDERPDLRSLAAQERAAVAAADLARARRIPDLTLRIGYTRDLFVVSGNQPRSLLVGVSLPLPLFDSGQADQRAALAQAEAARETRSLLLGAAARDAERLAAQARVLEERRRRVREVVLPAARSVVSRLDASAQLGAGSLQDLLLARRTLGELLLDAADLDHARFDLSLAQVRVGGQGPALPAGIAVP